MTKNIIIPQNQIWIYQNNRILYTICLNEINENRQAKHFFKDLKPNEFVLIKTEVLNCPLCKENWAVSGKIPSSLKYYANSNDLVAPCINFGKRGYYSQNCFHCKEEIPWRLQGYAGAIYCEVPKSLSNPP